MKGRPSKDDVIRFRCAAAEKAKMEAAAIREGFDTLSAWAIFHLRKAERESRKPHR